MSAGLGGGGATGWVLTGLDSLGCHFCWSADRMLRVTGYALQVSSTLLLSLSRPVHMRSIPDPSRKRAALAALRVSGSGVCDMMRQVSKLQVETLVGLWEKVHIPWEKVHML